MKNGKILFKIFIIVLMTGVSLLSYAESSNKWQDKDKYKSRGDFIDKIIKDIGLTPEQYDKIKFQSMEQKNIKEELYKTLIKKRKELKSELVKENIDKGVIEKIADEIKRLQSQIIDLRIEYVLKMKDVMTTEQYNEFNKRTDNILEGKRRKNRKKEF